VDLARALAVFGMFIVHVGGTAEAGLPDWVQDLGNGHASALFATLAGFSMTLIAGRFEPKTGLAGRQAKVRIAIRAVVLLAVGSAMAMTNFGGAGILNFYGVYFLLALPLVRLRVRTLTIIAATSAVVMPQVAFGLVSLLNESTVNSINAHDPLAQLCGVGFLDILLTGLYPAITWMTFVIAGMALGRLDLTSGAVQRRLAVVSAALIAFGYGVSWLVLRLSGGAEKIMNELPPTQAPTTAAGSFASGDTWLLQRNAWTLLGAEPHSASTFDLVGSVGIAMSVLLCVTVAMARLPWLRRLATPVIAVGTMSLTIYVGHVMAILALPGEEATPPRSASAALLACFIAGAILFAATWSRFFRRGPLEYLLHNATKLANSVR
jgi:uncharacterized membrane protein YeiB